MTRSLAAALVLLLAAAPALAGEGHDGFDRRSMGIPGFQPGGEPSVIAPYRTPSNPVPVPGSQADVLHPPHPSVPPTNAEILAPSRIAPRPNSGLSSLEQDKALLYRNQLQRQQRELGFQDSTGRLDPLGQRLLLDTNGALGRQNSILGN